MVVIILFALGYFAFINGKQSAMILAICMVSVLVSFLATGVIARKWIRKAPAIGLLGFDMNKPGKP